MAHELAEIEVHASKPGSAGRAARAGNGGELAPSELFAVTTEHSTLEAARWARTNAHTESLFPSSGQEGSAP